MTRVFLSYGRADEEAAPFASRLRDALVGHGFDVWFDLTSMPSRSLTFMQEIRDAIRGSDRLVVVLGRTAAQSEYVRAEWQAALVDEKVVVPIMRSGSFDDLPDELRTLPAFDGSDQRPFDAIVNELVRVLSEPVPPLSPLKGAIPDQPPHFRPRPDDMTRLAKVLLADVQRPVVVSGPERVHVLHGMGGSGKSVLAAAFARSTAARRVFVDGVIWAGASPDHSSLDVLRTLLVLLGAPRLELTTVPEAVSALRRTLAAGRTLVVLDNVWTLEQVTPVVQALAPSSRVLVTTREAHLAISLGGTAQSVEGLSDEAALQYLADWVGQLVDALPTDAVAVAEHCQNLPLALALQGALARQGVSWSDLLASLRAADVGYADHLLPDYPYRSVLQALEVSIAFLERSDPRGASRFRELAAFVWRGSVPEPAIVGFWEQHAGLPERYGRRLLTTLDQRALLRLEAASSPRGVRLHDLMAAVLNAKTDRAALNKKLLDVYRRRTNGNWPEVPPDGYIHAHLVEHLERAGAEQEIEALLLAEDAQGHNAWFAAQNRHGTSAGYLADVRRAWTHASVRAREELERGDHSVAVAEEFRYALICASVNTLSTGLTPPLLPIVAREEGWTAARTLAEARAIVVPEGRVEALASLAQGLSPDDLDDVVRDALAAVRNVSDPYWRAGALARLLRTFGARVTDADVARVVAGIDEPAQRAALETLIPHLRAGTTVAQFVGTPDAADSGFRDQQGLAAQLATFTPYTNDAFMLRHRYVDDSAANERALLAQAMSIVDLRTRSLVLAALCVELHDEAAAAARTAAIAAADTIGDGETAVALRQDLIAVVAASGRQNEALQIALAGKGAQSRIAGLAGLATQLSGPLAAQARQRALADFMSMPEHVLLEPIACDLAASLADAGELEAVRSIAAAARNGTHRRRMLTRAALQSSKVEDLLWAELDAVDGNVWPEAAAESAEALSVEHCRQVATRAAQLATAAERDPVRAALAGRLAVLGAAAEARALLPAIEDDVWRELAAVAVATTFADRGDARGAVEIAALVRQTAWRIRATAPALPLLDAVDRAGIVDGLVVSANASDDTQSSAHLRCLLIPLAEQATAERIAAAVAADAARLTDGGALACDLAVALARAGKTDEAISRANAIQDLYWRAEALIGIAPLVTTASAATQIIEHARTDASSKDQVAILTGVFAAMATSPPSACYRLWNEVLTLLGGMTRREIAEHRAWLTAALSDLTTDAGINASLNAVEAVFRWWP